MLDIAGNTIFLTDSGGDRPALLFVHGIMMSHAVWRHQVAEFSGDYRVVCVDLRGFGQSSAMTPDISFEDHAADLAHIIAKLSLTDVTLVGWSMGGAIAQVFAATYPRTLVRVVLVDTTPQLLASEAFPHALPAEAAMQLGQLLGSDFAQGCAAFSGMIAPEDAEATRLVTEIATATQPAIALAAFGNSGPRSLIELLPDIKTPTSVIAGADDRICLPGASSYLAAHIPGCTQPVAWIKDAGHAPFLTRPTEFNAALRAALAG
ncbi:alpha/beta fold hydrolase [Bradyrhizobium jicamae]|uniref:alpha/beta fold hydrolase n=1 Tax=Bradyrhizobium jicamae TaxID=280332 RepID=UPI001BA9E23E|nr:alpha/beta hydrolase [Bradyrhizobium jicamae]MBR0938905.1 alpha/beta hydrolase [Bradyrhizobium jicamae]